MHARLISIGNEEATTIIKNNRLECLKFNCAILGDMDERS